MHRKYEHRKRLLLRDSPQTVLELGPGTGANFRYLSPGTRVVALEPNPHMHKALIRRASEFGICLDLHSTSAETINLPNESVDLAFCSLVLCTVDNPDAVLAEIVRVLRPGGVFVCIEHVRAPAGSGCHRAQRILERPWYWLFEGCHLCRDTGATLHRAGFAHVQVEPFKLSTVIFPIAHQIQAICTR